MTLPQATGARVRARHVRSLRPQPARRRVHPSFICCRPRPHFPIFHNLNIRSTRCPSRFRLLLPFAMRMVRPYLTTPVSIPFLSISSSLLSTSFPFVIRQPVLSLSDSLSSPRRSLRHLGVFLDTSPVHLPHPLSPPVANRLHHTSQQWFLGSLLPLLSQLHF